MLSPVHRSRWSKVFTGLAVATLLLGACGGGEKEDGGADGASTAPSVPPDAYKGPGKVIDNKLERQLKVEVTGARTGSFDGLRTVRVVTRRGEAEHAAFALASITLELPIDLGGNVWMNPEVGVVGMYKGDGKYTLPAGLGVNKPRTGPTLPTPQAMTTEQASVAQVTFTTGVGTTPVDKRFDYLLEPCTVTLDDEGTEGMAKCPALVNIDGERVSMTISWSAPKK